MHFYADIKIVLTAILISVFFIIFPIFINLNAVYFNEVKRTLFCVDIFGFIKIFSGQIRFNKNEIIFECNNKRKIIKFDLNMFSKNNFKKLSRYHVRKLSSNIQLGSDNLEFIFNATNLINLLNNIFLFYIKNKKNYFVFNSNVDIFLNKKIFNYKINFQIILNILTIISNLIKNLLRNMKNDKKSKKSN